MRLRLRRASRAWVLTAGAVVACSGGRAFTQGDWAIVSGPSEAGPMDAASVVPFWMLSDAGGGNSSSGIGPSGSNSGSGSGGGSGSGNQADSGRVVDSRGGGGSGSGSSSGGAPGGCPTACATVADCQSCTGAQKGYIWCCSSLVGCYSASACGTGSSSGGGSNCGASGQPCCSSSPKCQSGLACSGSPRICN